MITWCSVCRRNIEVPGLGVCRPCIVDAGDELPEPPKPYYQRGPVTLYHGRAELVTPYLHEPGICLSDPQYSEHVHRNMVTGKCDTTLPSGGRRVDPGFEHLRAWERRAMANEARRLANRWVLFFADDGGLDRWRISLVVAGLEHVRNCFWNKGRGVQRTGDRPASPGEYIVVAHPSGRKRWNGGGKRGIYEHLSLIENANTEARENETQKPEGLMIELVEDFTEPGELVYDFTCGFATTAIACLRAKGGPRRFVGIEMRPRPERPEDPNQIEKAAQRVDAELSLSTYQAARAGQVPLFGGA